ncbi:MAG: hypothetical protein ACFFFH_19860 [Candidatus Thorarchaeota archaeon]
MFEENSIGIYEHFISFREFREAAKVDIENLPKLSRIMMKSSLIRRKKSIIHFLSKT